MRLRSPAKELPINTGKLGVGMSYADTKTLDYVCNGVVNYPRGKSFSW